MATKLSNSLLSLFCLYLLNATAVSAQSCVVQGANDCNANGSADGCDILNSTSRDCNRDTIPDECQLGESQIVISPSGIKFTRVNDCDASGMLDECKADCDASGVPDVCKQDLSGSCDAVFSSTQQLDSKTVRLKAIVEVC